MRSYWMVWILAASSSCRGIHTPQQRATWTNTGEICVIPTASVDSVLAGTSGEVTFAVGTPTSVVVTFSLCEACPLQAFASCTVDPDAGTENEIDPPWVVASEASYILRDDTDACPETCTPIRAQCELPTLAEGRTILTHGAEQLTIDVPNTTSSFCAGAPVGPVVTSE